MLYSSLSESGRHDRWTGSVTGGESTVSHTSTRSLKLRMLKGIHTFKLEGHNFRLVISFFKFLTWSREQHSYCFGWTVSLHYWMEVQYRSALNAAGAIRNCILFAAAGTPKSMDFNFLPCIAVLMVNLMVIAGDNDRGFNYQSSKKKKKSSDIN